METDFRFIEMLTGVQHGRYGQSSASGNASVCVRPVS